MTTEADVDKVAELLRRFQHPRSYAGDYCQDFARRIVAALDAPATEPDPPTDEDVTRWRGAESEDLGVEPDTTDPADGLSVDITSLLNEHADYTQHVNPAATTSAATSWMAVCRCGERLTDTSNGPFHGQRHRAHLAALLAAHQRSTQQTSAERVVEAVEAAIGQHAFGLGLPEWKTDSHNGAHDVIRVEHIRAALAAAREEATP